MNLNKFFSEDIREIEKTDFIPWERFAHKTIFITGGTGLIGRSIVKALLHINEKQSLGITILLLVRDRKKAAGRFKDMLSDRALCFVEGCVEHLPAVDMPVDFIIHGASQTASKEFILHPVETIETAVKGTMNLLELARIKGVEGFVYLSSMEVYGYPEKGHKVKEDEVGTFSPLDIRNSYPASKSLCELLCNCYGKEYNIPAKIVRLTQTFGPNTDSSDNRIFAYFVRCMIEKKNIELKTRGETERCYLHITDAVTAVLTVLLNGETGQAYNAADESTYCSIGELAESVAEYAGVKVVIKAEEEAKNVYPGTFYMNLDTTKIKGLGWFPIRNFS